MARSTHHLVTLIPRTPYHEELLRAAERYIEAGQPTDRQVAVVLAQTAVEIRTEQAFDVLRAHVQPEALRQWTAERLRRGYTLDNDAAKKLYEALSGHAIHQDSDGTWSRYRTDLLDLRNRMVHAGVPVSSDQAIAAVAAARALLARVESQVFNS